MDIKNINIKFYHSSNLTFDEPVVVHEKSLPYLTVAQSVEGKYGISIDRGEVSCTDEMGVFFSESRKHQTITHLAGKTGLMKAQWIFMNVIINDKYSLDDIYDFPRIFPPEHNMNIYKILSELQNNSDACDCHILIFKLIKLMLKIGQPKKTGDGLMHDILRYIDENYKNKIKMSELAKKTNISEPTLYRYFKHEFSTTPNNYINRFRLAQSVLLLETTDMTITQIAKEVGISDPFYYSKIFKHTYGKSPGRYNRKF